jgi:hypothetical protein
MGFSGLTFELTGLRRQTPTGRGRTIYRMAWSGQAVAAVAGRRLERGGWGAVASETATPNLAAGLGFCFRPST